MNAHATLTRGGSAATGTISGAHRELPLPQAPAWAGYWTFVTGTIIVMFILFTAKKGSLQQWLQFLWWTQPQPLASAGGAPASQAQGTGVGATPGQPGLVANPFAGLPSTLQQFLRLPGINPNSLIFGPGGAASPNTGANMGLGN